MGPRIREIQPNRYVVAGDQESGSWCLALYPTPHGCRLVSRWRTDWEMTLATAFWMLLSDPGAFIMEHKMLKGIKARAERAVHARQAGLATPSPGRRPPARTGWYRASDRSRREFQMRRALLAMLAALLLALLTCAPAVAKPDRLTPAARAATSARLVGTLAVAPAAWNQIMGAGDIDADPAGTSTADLATSEILVQANPATVFTAGDGQHPYGTIEAYSDPNGYAGSWGRPGLKSKTCPAVGNHDYYDPLPGPAGYLAYFSPPCPHRPDIEYARTSGGYIIPTVYAYRPAPGSGWWAYVLDSQCTHSEERGPSCTRYSNQLNWFRQHMAAHPVRCRVVFWHHPRFGNGAPFGDDSRVYWLHAVAAHAGRASLIINGHNHAYERFTSMTADGAIDRSFTAPRSFTVGTGGATLLPFSQPVRSGTRYRDASHHGVLRITLGNGYWVTEFDRIDGVVADKASAGC
jgi:Calcineurin-like phosphoesterase